MACLAFVGTSEKAPRAVTQLADLETSMLDRWAAAEPPQRRYEVGGRLGGGERMLAVEPANAQHARVFVRGVVRVRDQIIEVHTTDLASNPQVRAQL